VFLLTEWPKGARGGMACRVMIPGKKISAGIPRAQLLRRGPSGTRDVPLYPGQTGLKLSTDGSRACAVVLFPSSPRVVRGGSGCV